MAPKKGPNPQTIWQCHMHCISMHVYIFHLMYTYLSLQHQLTPFFSHVLSLLFKDFSWTMKRVITISLSLPLRPSSSPSQSRLPWELTRLHQEKPAILSTSTTRPTNSRCVPAVYLYVQCTMYMYMYMYYCSLHYKFQVCTSCILVCTMYYVHVHVLL